DLGDFLRRRAGACRPGADQAGEPVRLLLRLGGITNTQEAPAVVDVVLQRALLCRVQGGSFGGEENDATVLGEVLCGEVARVTGGRDREAVLCAEGLDRLHGLLDRIV